VTSGGNSFNDFAENQLIIRIFQWRPRRLQIQDKSRTPWNPGQDPEI